MTANRSFFLHVLNYAWILFILGMALLLWLHTLKLEDRILERAPVAVECEAGISASRVAEIDKWISELPETVAGSLQRIGAEELRQVLPDELPTDSAVAEAAAALNAIFVFRLTKPTYSKQGLETFKQKVEAHDGIRQLSYQNELTEDIGQSIARLRSALLLIVLLLVGVGILITSYLAQVFVDSRSAVILNWHALGASPEQILKNYRRRLLFLGVSSALIAASLVGSLLVLLGYFLPWTQSWIETAKFFWLLFVLIIFGPTLQYVLVNNKIRRLIQ
ncbi:MAG: hypothetical protein KBF37_05210 [Saprospiraceae bacterium]|nr:hypothetical protein [Saprospiraceae bacterium]MBP9209708.1 hypothetical protein [Saprospiraceae bacterium]